MLDLNTPISVTNQTKVPTIDQTKDLNKLKTQTDQFESLVLKLMLDISMKESENSLFGKTTGSDIYSSMYHDAMSKELAGGFGYSELLFNFLKKNI
ncbi:MAG: rod-binding protein [Campylobacterales bacterium]|nr:rod-binding protein [Campylobacterales bacterium]